MFTYSLATNLALLLQGSEAVVSSLLVVKHIDDHTLAVEYQGESAHSISRPRFVYRLLFFGGMLIGAGLFPPHLVHPAFLAVGQGQGADRLAVVTESGLPSNLAQGIGAQNSFWPITPRETWGHGQLPGEDSVRHDYSHCKQYVQDRSHLHPPFTLTKARQVIDSDLDVILATNTSGIFP